MDLQPKDDPPKTNQQFLVNFIMGNYLGPDIKFDDLKYSAFHRLAEGSPQYMPSDVGSSYVSVSLLEDLYYYILRNAHPNLVLRPSEFHKYIKGTLPLSSSGLNRDSWQFPNIFPSNLHQQIWYPESFRIVKGIVFIDEPVTSYMNEDDLKKFKSLSGMNNLKIDIDESRKYRHNCQNSGDRKNYFDDSHEADPKHGERECEGPVLTPLLSIPAMEECVSDPTIVLSGTVKNGTVGPPIGAVDIGVSKAAYYFRVSLPGIRKDFCQFNCEVESSGKVQIQGFTSGGNPIRKRSRVFQMKLQQLCPPGEFTLSFSLPGPVDPRLFAPYFGADGILEGVILKDE